MSSRLKFTLDVLQELRQHGYAANLTPELKAALNMAHEKGWTPQQFVEQLEHTPEAA